MLQWVPADQVRSRDSVARPLELVSGQTQHSSRGSRIVDEEVPMNSKRSRTLSLVVVITAAFSWPAFAQEGSISISNFPEIQTVDGGVEIAEPIPSNEMIRFPDITVTTVQRHQTNRLISGGVLETGPFTAVSLSLGGFVEGTPPEPATIGAVLVPDEDFVLEAFKEGVYLFPIEVTMTIPQESLPYVGTRSETHQLTFPSYRVYFYNTSQRTVKTQLYAFLMN